MARLAGACVFAALLLAIALLFDACGQAGIPSAAAATSITYSEAILTNVYTLGAPESPDAASIATAMAGPAALVLPAAYAGSPPPPSSTGVNLLDFRGALPSLAVSVATFGAVGDGVTDDTAAIQRALDAGPPARPFVYFPPGVYLISAELFVHSGTVVLGAGPALTTLRLAADAPAPNDIYYSMFQCAALPCANIGFDDITLDGNRQNQASVLFGDVEFGTTHLGAEGSGPFEMRDCVVMDSPSVPVDASDAAGVTFAYNQFSNTGNDGPTSLYDPGSTTPYFTTDAGASLRCSGCTGVTVTGNAITGTHTGAVAIEVGSSAEFSVSANTVNGAGVCIDVGAATHGTVGGNTCSAVTGGLDCESNTANVTVQNNTFISVAGPPPTSYGMFCLAPEAGPVDFVDNTVSGFSQGVYLEGAQGVLLSGGAISGAQGSGVYTVSGSGAAVTGLQISNVDIHDNAQAGVAQGDGITLGPVTTGASITGVTISGPQQRCGIDEGLNSTGNVFSNNQVSPGVLGALCLNNPS